MAESSGGASDDTSAGAGGAGADVGLARLPPHVRRCKLAARSPEGMTR
ncbi:hypothetical protein [Sorangium cellulosum]|nr:hypothetical protein [Sorangium cellulosum]